jgi:hypothetical protein
VIRDWYIGGSHDRRTGRAGQRGPAGQRGRRHGATLFANVTTWECERAPTVIDLTGDAIEPVIVPPRFSHSPTAPHGALEVSSAAPRA